MNIGTPQKQPGGRSMAFVSQNSVLIALVLLILFGTFRYEKFLSAFNVLTVLRYNSMFALVALRYVFRDHERRH